MFWGFVGLFVIIGAMPLLIIGWVARHGRYRPFWTGIAALITILYVASGELVSAAPGSPRQVLVFRIVSVVSVAFFFLGLVAPSTILEVLLCCIPVAVLAHLMADNFYPEAIPYSATGCDELIGAKKDAAGCLLTGAARGSLEFVLLMFIGFGLAKLVLRKRLPAAPYIVGTLFPFVFYYAFNALPELLYAYSIGIATGWYFGSFNPRLLSNSLKDVFAVLLGLAGLNFAFWFITACNTLARKYLWFHYDPDQREYLVFQFALALFYGRALNWLYRGRSSPAKFGHGAAA
jgi:hypothetical protein